MLILTVYTFICTVFLTGFMENCPDKFGYWAGFYFYCVFFKKKNLINIPTEAPEMGSPQSRKSNSMGKKKEGNRRKEY